MKTLELEVDEEMEIIEISMEGDVVVSVMFDNTDLKNVFIESYEVDPRKRGQGIGEQAYKLIRDYFKGKGVETIRLEAGRGTEDGPLDTHSPYNFWTLTCGFRDIGDGKVEDRL